MLQLFRPRRVPDYKDLRPIKEKRENREFLEPHSLLGKRGKREKRVGKPSATFLRGRSDQLITNLYTCKWGKS